MLDRLAGLAPTLEGHVDVATITFACCLGYLEYRFPERAWRETHPAAAKWYEGFRRRPSMKAIEPSG